MPPEENPRKALEKEYSPSFFGDFETVDFPAPEVLSSIPGRPTGFLYVIFWATDGVELPFYVGQTHRLSQRMKDYCVAQFFACADFRVGEAIRYLRDTKRCQIILRYKPSVEPRKDEYRVIRHLQLCGVRLLNELIAYDYSEAKKIEEQDVVRRFCELLLQSRPLNSSLR